MSKTGKYKIDKYLTIIYQSNSIDIVIIMLYTLGRWNYNTNYIIYENHILINISKFINKKKDLKIIN